MENNFDVILDCYSDEPSGYGVPPFLGVHQRYISSALKYLRRTHYYITIDDLRYAKNFRLKVSEGNSDISITNLTANTNKTLELLSKANTIYIVMGCFVEYEYVSALPPRSSELYDLIKDFESPKVLFYVLGSATRLPSRFKESPLFKIMDKVVTGLSYNFLLNNEADSFSPNYDLLSKITRLGSPIISQIPSPRIIEVESMIGCDWAKCSFCIERVRGYDLVFRSVDDIITDIVATYNSGARYFRIGRKPNFYSYMKQDLRSMDALLNGIRELCPDLKVLHIDNVNPESVTTLQGREITKMIVKYCTSGNIAPFGIESFDPVVRKKNSINATIEQIMEAISIMNEYGKEKGENGSPKYLNGINLIYNLPGQRDATIDFNLEYLNRIFEKGFHTQRLFFRNLSSPLGISMKEIEKSQENNQYESWKQRIYNEFSIPMLKRVFPVGTILKEVVVEAWINGDSILRQIGTSPPRIIVQNRTLPIGSSYSILVKEFLKHRTLLGEIIEN